MFKTMDGVNVYAADEVYNKEQVEEKLDAKATVDEVNNLVTQRIDDTIASKVNEIAGTFENTIDTKVATAITAEDIPGKVDTALADYDTGTQVSNKIDTALASYDNSDAVDLKISTAIGNIPSGPTAMTTSEATAIINNYF